MDKIKRTLIDKYQSLKRLPRLIKEQGQMDLIHEASISKPITYHFKLIWIHNNLFVSQLILIFKKLKIITLKLQKT